MISFRPAPDDMYAVAITCDAEGCSTEFLHVFQPEIAEPDASRIAEAKAVEAGWKRNVDIKVNRPRVTKYDGDGRPETVDSEPGTMQGDICPDCFMATEAA